MSRIAGAVVAALIAPTGLAIAGCDDQDNGGGGGEASGSVRVAMTRPAAGAPTTLWRLLRSMGGEVVEVDDGEWIRSDGLSYPVTKAVVEWEGQEFVVLVGGSPAKIVYHYGTDELPEHIERAGAWYILADDASFAAAAAEALKDVP